jgi:hypothetical protein
MISPDGARKLAVAMRNSDPDRVARMQRTSANLAAVKAYWFEKIGRQSASMPDQGVRSGPSAYDGVRTLVPGIDDTYPPFPFAARPYYGNSIP